MSYESPNYEVIARKRGYEVRRYDSYLVAETVVGGTFDGTGSQAFRRLAGYTFGNNTASKKMAMTVPVTRTGVDGGFAQRRRPQLRDWRVIEPQSWRWSRSSSGRVCPSLSDSNRVFPPRTDKPPYD
jgi:hypothetical protein